MSSVSQTSKAWRGQTRLHSQFVAYTTTHTNTHRNTHMFTGHTATAPANDRESWSKLGWERERKRERLGGGVRKLGVKAKRPRELCEIFLAI